MIVRCQLIALSAVRGGFMSVARSVHIAAPANSHIDESIAIAVSGLKSRQQVTISADVTRHGVTLSSFANFEVGADNEVNLARDPSLGGTYEGIEPMGLFTSMDLTSETKIVFKMVTGKVDYWPYVFRVFDGHTKDYDELRCRKPLAERTIHRLFLAKNVHRSEVRFKQFRGFLFTPNTVGPHPAVIDIFGGAWGLVAHRGSLLARHGYAVLCVAYAAYDDLPKQLESLDMGYFRQGYEYLKNYVPEIDGDRIGVMGSCLGGTLALALAREIPQIRAVAVVSPEAIAGGWSYKFPSTGEVIKGAAWEPERVNIDGTNYIDIRQPEIVPLLDQDASKTVDKWRKFSLNYGKIRNAPILIFYGGDDQLFPLKFSISALRQQFAEENKQNYEIVLYKNGGHIIQPCYMPLFSRYHSPIFASMVRYGGKLSYHTLAQVDMWSRCLAFFKSHLQEAQLDDYVSPKPVNIRRVNGKIVPSENINTQYQFVDFDRQSSSSIVLQSKL